jgi:uncharacterized protein
MLFDVGPFLRQPAGTTRAYRLSERQEELDGMAAADVRGTVQFLRTQRSILVSACLSVSSSDQCSRCLEPLRTSYAIEFQEEFGPTVDIETGLRLAPPDDMFEIDERQTLDLNEAIRQYRLAWQSMKPLCRSDCKGLCPECGANLNLAPCACSVKGEDTVDQPLAALQEIKAQISNKERGS